MSQGGFGKVSTVRKLRGPDSGQLYAMKALRKAVVLERNHVNMVLNERRLLAKYVRRGKGGTRDPSATRGAVS